MTALKPRIKSLSCPQGRLRRPKPVAALSAFLVERLTTDLLPPALSPAPCAPLASPAALSPAPWPIRWMEFAEGTPPRRVQGKRQRAAGTPRRLLCNHVTRRMSAYVHDARLGLCLSRRLRLCWKLKHRPLSLLGTSSIWGNLMISGAVGSENQSVSSMDEVLRRHRNTWSVAGGRSRWASGGVLWRADVRQAAPRGAARAGHGPTRTRGGPAGAKEQRRSDETRAPPPAQRSPSPLGRNRHPGAAHAPWWSAPAGNHSRQQSAGWRPRRSPPSAGCAALPARTCGRPA